MFRKKHSDFGTNSNSVSTMCDLLVDTNILEFVQQKWYPTTYLVCKEWKSAHEEADIAAYGFPDDIYELKDAVEEGMPLRAESIEAVLDHIGEYSSRKELLIAFQELITLLDGAPELHGSREDTVEVYAAYYEWYFSYLWSDKHGAASNIFYSLNAGGDEEKQKMLQFTMYPIAIAAARCEEFGILLEVVDMFIEATCTEESHFVVDGFSACDCSPSKKIRNTFADAIIEYDCDNSDMLGWAESIE